MHAGYELIAPRLRPRYEAHEGPEALPADRHKVKGFLVPDGMRQAKQPVSALLAGPYGHPYHPMLVTVPIGAWVASLVFDIASHLVGKPGFLTQGSEWLIAAGLLGALAAGLVGFLDLAAIPVGTTAFRTANAHMLINLMLMFAYAGNFAWRYRTYSHGAPVDVRMIAFSGVCMATLTVSGYLGGKLAYRFGVRVADESWQAQGYLAAEAERAEGHRAPRAR
jgi:uncharacterized membrane protein